MFPIGVLTQQNAVEFSTVDYIIYKGEAGTILYYKSVNVETGGVTDLGTLSTAPSNTIETIDTDGTFVFCKTGNYTTGFTRRQYSQNAGTFTQRLEAVPANMGNVNPSGLLYLPGNTGRLLASGGDGSGLWVHTYQSAPTYSWGAGTATTTAADTWGSLRDVRFTNPDTPGVGDGIVTFPNASSNKHLNSYTVAGATFTKHGGDLSIGSWAYGSAAGLCRDTGIIAAVGSASQSVGLFQYSMSNRQISSIGTSNATGINVACAAGCKGYVIILHTNGTLRAYSRSGTTLSQTGSIAFGGSSSTNNEIYVSPYTRHVYCSANGSLRCVRVNDNGSLTSVASHTEAIYSAGSNYAKLCFSPDALVNV